MMAESRVVIITGGTRGIGLATAKRFMRDGSRVVLASNDDGTTVKGALRELEGLGEAIFFPLDVSNEERCESVARETFQTFGRVDVLVNAAAVVDPLQPILEADLSLITRAVRVDLLGSIGMALSASKYMAQNGKGVIVNILSVCAYVVTQSNIGYHSAKSGLIMATATLARELAPHGIRCVGVAPGFTRTRLFDPSAEHRTKHCQMKDRIIEPEEIAGAIYLLADDRASAVNGTIVMADDGFCSSDGMKLVSR